MWLVDDVRDSYNSAYGGVSTMDGNRPLPGDSSNILGAAIATPIMLASHWIGGSDIHGPSPKPRKEVTLHKDIPEFERRNFFKKLKNLVPKVSQQPRVEPVDKKKNMSTPFQKKLLNKVRKKNAAKKVGNAFRALARNTRPFVGRPKNQRFKGKKFNKNISVGRKTRWIKNRYSPPVSKGMTLNSGPGINFFQAARPGCVGIQCDLRIGAFSSNSTGAVSLSTYSNTVIASTFPVAPQLASYYPPMISTFCGMFETYKVIKYRFKYVPSCSTATAGKMAFCVIQDPAAVKDVLGVTDNADDVPLTSLSGRTDLVESNTFSPFRTQWYVAQGRNMNYISGAYAPTDYVTWTTVSASLRDQVQSAFVFADQNIPASTSIGDLFMEMKIELCDMLAQFVGSSLEEKQRVEQNKQLHRDRNYLDSHATELAAMLREFSIGKTAPDDAEYFRKDIDTLDYVDLRNEKMRKEPRKVESRSSSLDSKRRE